MALTLTGTGQGGVFTLRAGSFGGRFQASVTPPASATLLLDAYPNAEAAYSVRKLRTAYTGSAIRVRRSSDNTETDIGFTGSGNLDTTSLTTFCGVGNGFVTTWYDQSVNGYHVSQSTSGNQPRIVNAGTLETTNSKPAVRFIRANSTYLLNASLTTSLTTNRYISSVQKVNTYVDFGVVWSNLSAGNFQLSSRTSGGNKIYIFDNPGIIEYKILNTSQTFLNTISNTNSYLNSSDKISVPNSKQFLGLMLGSSGLIATTDYLDGWVHEFIFYNSSQDTNINSIENNVSIYYNIKPSNTWVSTGTALLDLYPGSAAAYSIRNLSSTYTGALLRVRRSSDNAELDIFGTTLGALDTASLLSFCGTGSGFVSTWYDQSGGYNHLLQTTNNNQPQIVSSGTYLGYLLYDGVNDTLAASTGNISWNGSSNALITTVTSPDASTVDGVNDSYPTVQIPEIASWGTIYQTVGPTFLKWRFGTGESGNNNSIGRTSSTAFCIVNSNKTSTTETLYLNNSLVATATGKASTMAGNSSSNINIAASPSTLWKGFQKEIIMYNSNQSANISAINTNINSYYSIY